MRKKSSRLLNMLMLGLLIVTLYPFWHTVVVSFNDARDAVMGGLYFWPRVPTLYNYTYLFKEYLFMDSLRVSAARAALTAVLNVLFSSLFAYVLSRKEFVLNKFLTVYMVIALYVSAGLIPQYFLYRNLHLINSFWVYILPSLYSAFNVVVIRAYMRKLPDSLAESAKIDGANELTVFFSVVFPLCMPVAAAMALLVAADAWNEWFDTFIFAPRLSTLPHLLMQNMTSSTAHVVNPYSLGSYQPDGPIVTPNSVRAMLAVIIAIPPLAVYPFFQKHFIHGIHYGSVKR